ncbi:MAG: ShlB/FhaC/HecB family hemolysin secretion/activation protein [Cyanobacteria bacterium P01_F01_bin.56]
MLEHKITAALSLLPYLILVSSSPGFTYSPQVQHKSAELRTDLEPTDLVVPSLGFTATSSPLLLSQQTLPLPPDRPAPLPQIPDNLEPLPDPSELLPVSPEGLPDNSFPLPDEITETVNVSQFELQGNTVFTDEQILTVLAPFLNRPLTFLELLEARDAVTQLYVDAGYITSGALIPADQIIDSGIVIISILEGKLADIKVEGNQRLKPEYIQSRIALASGPPINIDALLQALQLLQLDPLIDSIAAELVTTPNPGENSLVVRIQEAETFALDVQLNNYENPLLSTFQQAVEASEQNLTGNGDTLKVRYQHADRSNFIELDYNLPVSPHNTQIDFGYSYGNSEIVEAPFNLIAPQSESHTWEVGVRHPIVETVQDRVTLGFHLEQRSNQSFIQPPGLPRIPFGFPGTGATEDGFTRITTLKFSQEWQNQTPNHLLLLESRFRLGTSWLGATTSSNPNEPETEFFVWQGQALWLQRLHSEWLLVTRAAGQVADRPLVASELFGLGGVGNVRGYRKDQILADSGLIASIELRAPILDWPEQNAIGIISPFLDYGYAWNDDGQFLDQQSLASIGAGFIFQIDDDFIARLDYALPLVNTSETGNTWQESGFLFGINIRLF